MSRDEKLNVVWWLMVAFLAAVLVIGIASEKARLDSLPPDQRVGIFPNLTCYRSGKPTAEPALPPRQSGEPTDAYVNRMVQWLEDYRHALRDSLRSDSEAAGRTLPTPEARQAPRD